MIASSRKKTDRRDAYWIARALQSGMYPHPVYIPKGEIRELRALLTRRRMIQTDRNRWQYRARSALRASGYKVRAGGRHLRAALEELLASVHGIDSHLLELLELCQRQEASLSFELKRAEAELREQVGEIEAIGRLQTIPGVGELTATTIYAWVGDVRRFPDAKALAAYAGLVPSIRQRSGATLDSRNRPPPPNPGGEMATKRLSMRKTRDQRQLLLPPQRQLELPVCLCSCRCLTLRGGGGVDGDGPAGAVVEAEAYGREESGSRCSGRRNECSDSPGVGAGTAALADEEGAKLANSEGPVRKGVGARDRAVASTG
jgi:hypothetical protein